MLGKLMKHDMKNMGRLLLPLNAIVLLMTLAGVILRATGLFELENAGPLLGILLTTYVIGMVVIAVVSYFYPIIHYYRNLFSRQGYLTFTLPVSTWKILFSKTIVGYGWYLVNIGVALFSVWAITGFLRIPSTYIVNINDSLMRETGMTFSTLMGWVIVVALISLLWSLLTAYFSISVGQLYAKHKIIASVVAYIAIYTVMQILVTIVLLPFLLRGAMLYGPSVHTVVSASFYSTLIFSILFSVLFYLFSGLIIKKKVNLD